MRHSTEGHAPNTPLRRSWLGLPRRAAAQVATALALTSAFSVLAPPAQGDDARWRDIESRIQYNYYTEDARALAALEDTVAGVDAQAPLHDYYLGLLSYRQALLAAQGAAGTAAGSAGQLASRCVAHLDAALASNSDFAEALALRAACVLAPLASGSYAPLAAHHLHKDVSRALQLAPGNPRVLLIDAISDYQLLPSSGGNKERALTKLRQAAVAFEAERRDTPPLPGWGAAEASVFLARDLLDHGDAVAARDALESALVSAPEFLQARRLMAKITSG